jgi:hypothetical protein
MKSVMEHRLNWEYTPIKKEKVNFVWHYSYKKINYQAKKCIFNIFDNHVELTDKKRFFINFLQFCNVKIFFYLNLRKTI